MPLTTVKVIIKKVKTTAAVPDKRGGGHVFISAAPTPQ